MNLQWIFLRKAQKHLFLQLRNRHCACIFLRATIEREEKEVKGRVCGKEAGSIGHLASGCLGLV